MANPFHAIVLSAAIVNAQPFDGNVVDAVVAGIESNYAIDGVVRGRFDTRIERPDAKAGSPANSKKKALAPPAPVDEEFETDIRLATGTNISFAATKNAFRADVVDPRGKIMETWLSNDGVVIQFCPSIKPHPQAWVRTFEQMPEVLPLDPRMIGAWDGRHASWKDYIRSRTIVAAEMSRRNGARVAVVKLKGKRGDLQELICNADTSYLPTHVVDYLSDGTITRDTTIEHDRVAGKYFPKRAVRLTFAAGTKTLDSQWVERHTMECKDVKVERDPALNRLFDLEFPAGTLVSDSVQQRLYRVKAPQE
jgi:hypothetical protein